MTIKIEFVYILEELILLKTPYFSMLIVPHSYGYYIDCLNIASRRYDIDLNELPLDIYSDNEDWCKKGFSRHEKCKLLLFKFIYNRFHKDDKL